MKILIWLFAALVFSLGSSTAMYASDPATGSVCVILFGVFAFWIARTLCKAHDKSKNNSSAENTFVAYSSEPVYFSENILSAPLTENNNVLFASSDEIIDTTKTDGTVSKSPKPHKTVPLYLFVISCLLLVSSLSLFSWQFFEKQKLQEQIATLTAENSQISNQISLLKNLNAELTEQNNIYASLTTKYVGFLSVGIDREDCYALVQKLNELKPMNGKHSVSNIQRYRTITDTIISSSKQELALLQLMSDNEGIKLKVALSVGFTPEEYVTALETIENIQSGKSITQKEAQFAISKLSLTNNEKAALWQLQNELWNVQNNPFSHSVGEYIVSNRDYYKEKQAQLQEQESQVIQNEITQRIRRMVLNLM